MMTGRLILAIISFILEETAIVVIVLLGLPRLDVHLPLPVLITMMVAWAAFSVFTYRMGSRALRRKPVLHLPDMVGSTGTVANRLAPDGLVKIKGELWVAKLEEGELEAGSRIIVVGQDRLKLNVRASNPDNDTKKAE
ncbi:MAG: NfeD family protein [Dehalococcoidales bacterium]|nr:MAG: NfeD family protein [Dehalococcoidales bacterium]